MKPLAFILCLAGLLHGYAHAAPLPLAIATQLDASYPAVETLYQQLHRNPELGFNEQQTAATLARLASSLGFDVSTGIGATGVVAILRNGAGPTVMLRTEMDALPVLEKTGLSFASKVTTKTAAGALVPVAHACGHDLHMAAWYGTAKLMSENRAAWRGTLMLVGQPAEELLSGASAMLKDGLFERFPRPDYALSMHNDASGPSGVVMYRAGAFRGSADTVRITVQGRGGHGAVPQDTRDPVVIAARIVLALQTLVSRENDPFDPAVITVGSIHGGTRANIIPDQVTLELSVRAFKPAVRARLLASIAREVKGEAIAAGAPKEPLIEILEGAEPVYNDPALMARTVAVLQGALGDDFVREMPARLTSEDFSQYGAQAGVRSILLHVGAVDPARLAAARRAGQPLPVNHSPEWAPDFKPTVTTTIKAELAILLDLMAPPR